MAVGQAASTARGLRFPRGYREFLEVVGDPCQPEHDALLESVRGNFDPEAFAAAVNRALAVISEAMARTVGVPCGPFVGVDGEPGAPSAPQSKTRRLRGSSSQTLAAEADSSR